MASRVREMLEQLGHAHRIQAQIEAKMGAERKRRPSSGARTARRATSPETRKMLWADFQETQRHLRRKAR